MAALGVGQGGSSRRHRAASATGMSHPRSSPSVVLDDHAPAGPVKAGPARATSVARTSPALCSGGRTASSRLRARPAAPRAGAAESPEGPRCGSAAAPPPAIRPVPRTSRHRTVAATAGVITLRRVVVADRPGPVRMGEQRVVVLRQQTLPGRGVGIRPVQPRDADWSAGEEISASQAPTISTSAAASTQVGTVYSPRRLRSISARIFSRRRWIQFSRSVRALAVGRFGSVIARPAYRCGRPAGAAHRPAAPVTCWRSAAPPARRRPGTGPCTARCAGPGR